MSEDEEDTIILIYYSTEYKDVYMNPFVERKVLSDGVFVDRDKKRYEVKYYTAVHKIAFAVEEGDAL